MNDLAKYAGLLDRIKPFVGHVDPGFLVDFLGTKLDANFRTMWGVDPKAFGGGIATTKVPTISDGEAWFEATNWMLAAQEAREKFVMVTLGACYGGQAVGSYLALQMVNPMPALLVAVEPDPGNVGWIKRHMRDNGIDPDEHWIVPSAISGNNEPVLFPVGATGSGVQNCFSSNHDDAREHYIKQIIESGKSEEAIANLFRHNTTGIKKDLSPDSEYDFMSEIKMVSAVTLHDILGPFKFVDYLEADIQQSEILVFPPCMGILKKKVRRAHIGTHGDDVHAELLEIFKKDGWEIVFNYAPNKKHESALGSFETNDGVLSVRNSAL